jgi:succinate dehydrogenase/fumarate reductase flavoprotein subunit
MAVDYRVRSSSNSVNGKVAAGEISATVPAAGSRATGSFSSNVLFFGKVARLANFKALTQTARQSERLPALIIFDSCPIK